MKNNVNPRPVNRDGWEPDPLESATAVMVGLLVLFFVATLLGWIDPNQLL